MNKLLTNLALIAIFFSTSTVYAAAGAPVSHSHNGRTHSHSLPAEGRSHKHGAKPTPKPKSSYDEGEGWTRYASSDLTIDSYKKYSFERVTTKSGTKVTVAIIKVYTLKSKSTSVYKAYVSDKDCKNGFGEVVHLTMTGDYKYSQDFAEGAGSMISSRARELCSLVKEESAKSL